MAWYDVGTVAVTNGSATVTGTGTDWISGARVGDGFKGPDGEIYEVASIGSATSITLGETYKGSTTSGAAYSIAPTQSLTANLASQVTTLITDYQTGLDAIDSGIFKAANGAVTTPSLTFANDLNTGIYSIAADNLGVAVSGVKVLDLVSTGVNADLRFLDNKKATFGTSDDLQIYHDGTNSYITDGGTGDLNILGSNLNLKSGSGAVTYASGSSSTGAFTLYKGTAKLTTTDSGIDVTGTVVADGLTVDGSTVISGGSFSAPAAGDGILYSTATSGLVLSGEGTTTDVILVTGAGSAALSIDANKDVRFYDDGGTAKLFWDASATALSIGTTTGTNLLSLGLDSFSAGAADTSGIYTDSSSKYLTMLSDGYTWNSRGGSEFARITSTGYMGLGVTPKPWSYGGKGISLTNNGFIHSNDVNLNLYSNMYYNGTQWIASATGYGAYQGFANGAINWGTTTASATAGAALTPQTNMSLATNGNLTLNTGNLVIGTAGKGIDFSANGNAAGMTSELLDDYEEGTWTPTIYGSSTAGSYTYSSGYARYTKIGNLVTVSCTLDNITEVSAGSGYIKIGGLPFTKGSSKQATGVARYEYLNLGTSNTAACVQFISASAGDVVYLRGLNSGGIGADVLISGITSGQTDISIQVAYEV